jgi:hypothetical protein
VPQLAAPRLFSILFTSVWLALFYQGRLAAGRKDAGALRLLLRALFNGPRDVRATQIRHVSGHCYVIDLDDDYPCDETGSSILMLVEEGAALPRPHTMNLQDIIRHGAGRYAHARRHLFFSPSDNTDLSQQPRRYTVLESLTGDLRKDAALIRLNEKRAIYPNTLLWALEKARVYLGPRFTFSAVAETAGNGLMLSEVGLDLSALGLGSWRMDALQLAWQPEAQGGRLELAMSRARTEAIDGVFDVQLVMRAYADGCLYLDALRCLADGQPSLKAALDWQGEQLQVVELSLDDPAGMRALLVPACGGEAGVRQWLDGFLESLQGGALSFGCRLDLQGMNCLSETLLQEASARPVQLLMRRVVDGWCVSAGHSVARESA